MRVLFRLVLLCLVIHGSKLTSQDSAVFDVQAAERFARLALDCVHREYPNKISHVMQSDADSLPPRKLTPAFYGCFDWHSAVHGHWLLVRLLRLHPEGPFAADARAALGKSFTEASIIVEVEHMKGKGRASWERPYGLAWLLQLSAELHEWDDEQGREWAKTIEPLEEEVANRLKAWFPKLSHPIRTGEHSQTAFAMGLVLDWARSRGEKGIEALITERALDYYHRDRGYRFAFEPGGQDFLSPGLAEADLMRRVLVPAEFAAWLGAFAPEIPLEAASPWLSPAVVTDKADGKLAHLDGLNLARAWMLEGIAAGLPAADPRLPQIVNAAREHRRSGLLAVTGSHYEGGHWLGSFAVYLVTRRGLSSKAEGR